MTTERVEDDDGEVEDGDREGGGVTERARRTTVARGGHWTGRQ
jgi:hypothetical protein